MMKSATMLLRSCAMFVVGAVLVPAAAFAQIPLDRADPTIIRRQLPVPPPTTPAPTVNAQVEQAPVTTVSSAPTGAVVRAVAVEGREALSPTIFATDIAGVVGRALSREELGRLAADIGARARASGYPFATASIPAQRMADGVLRVTLDLGRIDAVRVIGARNAIADRLLSANLVTGRGVRQAELEHALLLLGDIPGLRVKNPRFVRQDGFGILLVTIEQDRAQAYAQIDNRGSREVGPVRSTVLASLYGLLQDGDEASLIVAQTPVQPSEFIYVRGRYAARVDTHGSALSVAASYGRSHPGASLRPLDIVGESVDVSVAYARPLVRSRRRSLSAQLELRHTSIDQTISNILLRRDRLSTLTASLNGVQAAAGGVLRAEIDGVAGLPLGDVTRAGDRLASRSDGDARFVAATFAIDWTAPITGPFSVALASAGQIASRPLLATSQIGLGGPQFGRAYDYAERTGDKGIMASAELRANLGRRGLFDRMQLYGFADAGTVANINLNAGGGDLYSSGGGVRAGLGRFDSMLEFAFPLNDDRFDTGNRAPRISARVSMVF